jgi:hypothetical protein
LGSSLKKRINIPKGGKKILQSAYCVLVCKKYDRKKQQKRRRAEQPQKTERVRKRLDFGAVGVVRLFKRMIDL